MLLVWQGLRVRPADLASLVDQSPEALRNDLRTYFALNPRGNHYNPLPVAEGERIIILVGHFRGEGAQLLKRIAQKCQKDAVLPHRPASGTTRHAVYGAIEDLVNQLDRSKKAVKTA